MSSGVLADTLTRGLRGLLGPITPYRFLPRPISTDFHDSTWPPSKNVGHCLEIDTGSQLEDVDAAMSSIMVRNSNTQNPPVLIRPYRPRS
jgi:hypothetical protein